MCVNSATKCGEGVRAEDCGHCGHLSCARDLEALPSRLRHWAELHQALERGKYEGLTHVILDGKIIPGDRCKEPAVSVKGQVIDLWYSGKAHTHGGNIQAVLRPRSPVVGYR